MISERLEKLVEEMVEKGVHFEDAVVHHARAEQSEPVAQAGD